MMNGYFINVLTFLMVNRHVVIDALLLVIDGLMNVVASLLVMAVVSKLSVEAIVMNVTIVSDFTIVLMTNRARVVIVLILILRSSVVMGAHITMLIVIKVVLILSTGNCDDCAENE